MIDHRQLTIKALTPISPLAKILCLTGTVASIVILIVEARIIFSLLIVLVTALLFLEWKKRSRRYKAALIFCDLVLIFAIVDLSTTTEVRSIFGCLAGIVLIIAIISLSWGRLSCGKRIAFIFPAIAALLILIFGIFVNSCVLFKNWKVQSTGWSSLKPVLELGISGYHYYVTLISMSDIIMSGIMSGIIIVTILILILLLYNYERSYNKEKKIKDDIQKLKMLKEIKIYEEIQKLKIREERREIREEAEKRVYGQAKTTRIPLIEEEKESIFQKFNNECSICGKTEGLHIHHKNGDATDNRIINLTVLCGVCHKKIHMKVR